MGDVEWMDCPDCDNGTDPLKKRRLCPVCEGSKRIPVDMSTEGMIAAGLGHRVNAHSDKEGGSDG